MTAALLLCCGSHTPAEAELLLQAAAASPLSFYVESLPLTMINKDDGVIFLYPHSERARERESTREILSFTGCKFNDKFSCINQQLHMHFYKNRFKMLKQNDVFLNI